MNFKGPNMTSPFKNNIVLKGEDDGISERSLLVPMWHPRMVYPSIVSEPHGYRVGGDNALFC